MMRQMEDVLECTPYQIHIMLISIENLLIKIFWQMVGVLVCTAYQIHTLSGS